MIDGRDIPNHIGASFLIRVSSLERLERRKPPGTVPNARMVRIVGTTNEAVTSRDEEGPAGKSRMETWRFEYSTLPNGTLSFVLPKMARVNVVGGSSNV
jgi:hypothetical protein